MKPDVCFNGRIVNNGSCCIWPRISDQCSAIHSQSLHTDNKWHNWTYNQMCPVNITGQPSVLPVMMTQSVPWLVVISSPEKCISSVYRVIHMSSALIRGLLVTPELSFNKRAPGDRDKGVDVIGSLLSPYRINIHTFTSCHEFPFWWMYLSSTLNSI